MTSSVFCFIKASSSFAVLLGLLSSYGGKCEGLNFWTWVLSLIYSSIYVRIFFLYCFACTALVMILLANRTFSLYIFYCFMIFEVETDRDGNASNLTCFFGLISVFIRGFLSISMSVLIILRSSCKRLNLVSSLTNFLVAYFDFLRF